MKAFLSLLLSIFLFSSFSGCKTGKKPTDTGDCQTVGTVKDFSGLDGCKILILLDNGTKLLPSSISDANFKLADGQRIAFDYEEDPEFGMTICMAEDMIVKITCIKLLGELDPGDVCINTSTPEKVAWMRQLIEKNKPIRITRYPYGKEYVYFYQGKTDSQLFDCRGKLVCEMPGNEKNVCYDQIQTFEQGRVIFLGEGPRE